MRPTVIIPWLPGTNCHEELARAFRLAGATPHIVTLQELADREVRLYEADLIGWAGGFSYGDHFRSGAFAANDLLELLGEDLMIARQKKIPMLGICNGFQLLVECGLLPSDDLYGRPTAVLDRNDSGQFVHLAETVIVYFKQPNDGRPECVWIGNLDGRGVTLPVAHGEGRLFPETSYGYRVVGVYGAIGESRSPNGSPIYGGDQGLAIFKAGVASVK
jgi:phosphoribosylformylglycinamidine (FGAM) synthase-like amidotransferase family enzyme